MKRFSESQCLAKLSLHNSNITQEELYRAAVYAANSGRELSQSMDLSLPMRLLIETRQLIANQKLPEALHLLTQISKRNDLNPEIQGDLPFLLGMIQYRQGNWQRAGELMNEAKLKFLSANDMHRALRSLINQEIAKEDLSSFESGPLKALHQQCLREQTFDLAGNISKAESIDALKFGKLTQASSAARNAIENYQKDGCPEDASVAACMGAITNFLLGQMEEAFKIENSIAIASGKVKDYYDAWSLIKNGKVPKLTSGHPLVKVPWEKFLTKTQSISGKIIARLELGPANKYDLIEHVWGKDADNQSYESRLFSAFYQIKKKNLAHVQFDGERYSTHKVVSS